MSDRGRSPTGCSRVSTRSPSSMGAAEHNVFADMQCPKESPSRLHSTNTLERRNEEAVERLVGAVLLERHEEWAIRRRYMPVETLKALCQSEDTVDPPALAAE